MKLNVFLVVVGVSHCAAVLLNPPKNANIVYKHDDLGRLVEIEIDHHDPKPISSASVANRHGQKTWSPTRAAPKTTSKIAPQPTFRRAPVSQAAPTVQIQGPRVIYQQAPVTPARTPTTYRAPASKPVPARTPTRTLYFIEDDDEFEQVFPMMFRLAAPVTPAPSPAPVVYRARAPAPAPVSYRAPAPVSYRAPAPAPWKPATPVVRRFSVKEESDEDDK